MITALLGIGGGGYHSQNDCNGNKNKKQEIPNFNQMMYVIYHFSNGFGGRQVRLLLNILVHCSVETRPLHSQTVWYS